MVIVEEQDERAASRVSGELAAAGHGVRLDPRRLRAGGPHQHVLEGGDLLRRAILEQLEVSLRQIVNRHAVARGDDIDAHVVGFNAERGLLRRRLPLRRRLLRRGRLRSRRRRRRRGICPAGPDTRRAGRQPYADEREQNASYGWSSDGHGSPFEETQA